MPARAESVPPSVLTGRSRERTGDRQPDAASQRIGHLHAPLPVTRDVAADDPVRPRRPRRPARSRRGPRAGPSSTTMRMPGHVGRHADDRGRAGWGAGRRGLGGLPGVLHAGIADDRLVDVETAVDDVEEDRLAGDQVERVRQERVVLGDEVDLARRVGRRRRRRAAWPAPGRPRRRPARSPTRQAAGEGPRRRPDDGRAHGRESRASVVRHHGRARRAPERAPQRP